MGKSYTLPVDRARNMPVQEFESDAPETLLHPDMVSFRVGVLEYTALHPFDHENPDFLFPQDTSYEDKTLHFHHTHWHIAASGRETKQAINTWYQNNWGWKHVRVNRHLKVGPGDFIIGFWHRNGLVDQFRLFEYFQLMLDGLHKEGDISGRIHTWLSHMQRDTFELEKAIALHDNYRGKPSRIIKRRVYENSPPILRSKSAEWPYTTGTRVAEFLCKNLA